VGRENELYGSWPAAGSATTAQRAEVAPNDLDRVLRPVRLVVDEDTALGREIGRWRRVPG
jgi:hypothetical protein